MADYEEKNDKEKTFTLFNNETGHSYEIPVLKGKFDHARRRRTKI